MAGEKNENVGPFTSSCLLRRMCGMSLLQIYNACDFHNMVGVRWSECEECEVDGG